MDRRQFLEGGVGVLVTVNSRPEIPVAAGGAVSGSLTSPDGTLLNVLPVMTNIIHTGVWEGPCRWSAVSVAQEEVRAKTRFEEWPKQLAKAFGFQSGVELLPPVHVTFSEDFKLSDQDAYKLSRQGESADILFVSPHGSSVMPCEMGRHLGKPIVLDWGLNCRTVDIAAYGRSVGQEVYVPADDEELSQLMVTLQARKVYRQTHVLFPSDRGLPPVASVASINDLEELQEMQGVRVTQISYQELGEELNRIQVDKSQNEAASQLADELSRGAQCTLVDRRYVVRSVQFYQTVRSLMTQYGCNAFTIECFEFCSSRLPEKWKITPCLVHTLLKDEGFASSCEGDFPALLAMRLLMSISRKSAHLGNMFLRDGDILAINHSAPGIRMNGYEEPGLPYKLGRFTDSGWGTKVIVDFGQNEEKRVTVARIDPTALRMLILEGELVGSDGWDGDNLGCSVEAQIRPLKGKSEDYARKQLDYGNHLVWVYGHYGDELRRLGETLGMEVDVVL